MSLAEDTIGQAGEEARMSELERQLRATCRDDLVAFSRACLKVRPKEPGPLRPLVFNRAQKHLHDRFQTQLRQTGMVRQIIVKGRQMGCSTYVAARFYQKTSHFEGLHAFILTHLDDATKTLFNMVDTFHENNNPLVKPITGHANAKELTFPHLHSGYTVGTAGSQDIGRSKTIQLFHGSEVAMWANAEDHVAGVLQCVPLAPGTEVALESTAKGLSNYFATEWSKAVAGKSLFWPTFMPWFWDDDYRLKTPEGFELTREEKEYKEAYQLDNEQMNFRRSKMQEFNDEWRWAQEYPATQEEAFQSSGEGSFIKPINVFKSRRFKADVKPYIPIVIGVDPSGGGRDFTAFIDRQGRKVGGNIYEVVKESDAMALAGKIINLIRTIKPKKVVVDATEGTGDAICDRLNELGFGKFVEPVKFSNRAFDEANYANRRAEMYAEMRNWFSDPLGVEIPDDDKLQSEVTAAIWGPGATRHNSSGQLLIEPKEHIVKRIGVSPDRADALALTFGVPVNFTPPPPPQSTAPDIASDRAGY